MIYDYSKLIEKTAPPGAEGANEGNGRANQYIDTSPPTVPVDSKLTPEEQKVLKEATTEKNSPQGSVRITVSDAPQQQPPKKKPGFFKRLFGWQKKRPVEDHYAGFAFPSTSTRTRVSPLPAKPSFSAADRLRSISRRLRGCILSLICTMTVW